MLNSVAEDATNPAGTPISQLAESVITMPMLKELVYVHRVRIVSVTEGIDSSQNNWDLLANFMSWVHEQYLKVLREAVL